MTSSMRPRRINLDRMSVQIIHEETLVYNELDHQAWCLNKISGCIWRLCDGQKTVQQITTTAAADLDAPVTVDIVLLTLAELRDKNLLEQETLTHLPDSVTRREMMGKAGLAAAVLLPLIASILAPPARAQSGSLQSMARLKSPDPKG